MSRDLAPPAREIAWTHYLVISGRCSDSLERELYIRVTKEFGWPWQERQIVQEVLSQIESEQMAEAVKRDFRV